MPRSELQPIYGQIGCDKPAQGAHDHVRARVYSTSRQVSEDATSTLHNVWIEVVCEEYRENGSESKAGLPVLLLTEPSPALSFGFAAALLLLLVRRRRRSRGR